MSALGLFPVENFTVAIGCETKCDSVPQALWYFAAETVAVPRQGVPLAGYDPHLRLEDDLHSWVKRISCSDEPDYPPLIWLGSPSVLRAARVTAQGQGLITPQGEFKLQLAERLPLNSSWFDASSLTFFGEHSAKLRGCCHGETFVARTFWPESWRLTEIVDSPVPVLSPTALRDLVRSSPAHAPFATVSLWQKSRRRTPGEGQPILGLMLNGAQGDDDEAHSGHFAVMTGRVGEGGRIDDWLVNNFYTLDAESEKGIIAAPVPLDNYLGDLNSGQAWYRPSWMLVATLAEPRAAHRLQSAFGRVFNQFYRHQFAYNHARANCAGISVTTARALGWQVPARGPESWFRAILALPLVALRERSLVKGKAMFDYLTEDQTRLYPAAAFAEMGGDLLRLVAGQAGRPLGEFEAMLAADVEQIVFIRLPQIPSSRAWGSFPAENSIEYRARVPKDPAQRQIVPVPPRPFPPELRDPRTPTEPLGRADYAVIGWGLAIVALVVFILRRLLA
nr:hypothetical protein [Dechloromonas sp.]